MFSTKRLAGGCVLALFFSFCLGNVPVFAEDISAKAKKILTFPPESKLFSAHFDGNNYVWVSPRKLVYCQYHKDGKLHFLLYDLDTKRTGALLGLDRNYRKRSDLTFELQASPGGKWIVWQNNSDDSARGGSGTSTLDGEQTFVTEDEKFHRAWTDDKGNWIALNGRDDLSTDLESVSLFHFGKKTRRDLKFPSKTRGTDYNSPVVTTRKGSSLQLHFVDSKWNRDSSKDTCSIETYEIGQKLKAVSSQRMEVPPKLDVARTLLSPNARLVMWACRDKKDRSSLWLTEVATGKTKFFAKLPPDLDHFTSIYNSLLWLPDSRGISFVSQGTLYLFDVKQKKHTY